MTPPPDAKETTTTKILFVDGCYHVWFLFVYLCNLSKLFRLFAVLFFYYFSIFYLEIKRQTKILILLLNRRGNLKFGFVSSMI